MTDGDKKLFETLSQDQRILFLMGCIDKQREQIAELYELNRGAIKLGGLRQLLLMTGAIITAIFTIGKGINAIEHYFLVKNDNRMYSEQYKDKGEGQ